MSEQAVVVPTRRRSPATLPGFGKGRPPQNKGRRYPADPPRPEEIIAVMRVAGGGAYGLRIRAREAGVRRRFAPHQLRHAHAVEMAREGLPINVIQRQLGHCNLGVTSVYLQGIDTAEIVELVHGRPAPVIPASNGLAL